MRKPPFVGSPSSTESLPADIAEGAGTAGDTDERVAPDLSESDLLRLEVATYICQMSGELGRMARGSDMPLLSYFLDMATAEARDFAEKLGGLPAQSQTAPQFRT
jgi:hypothetical protein